jgi:hypothetical protein
MATVNNSKDLHVLTQHSGHVLLQTVGLLIQASKALNVLSLEWWNCSYWPYNDASYIIRGGVLLYFFTFCQCYD